MPHISKQCCLFCGKCDERILRFSRRRPYPRQLYRTFQRGQAFLRGVTIGWDLAWFHYVRNNVFSRLRLVISRRFRRRRIYDEALSRTGLARRTRNNGQRWWYHSPICDSNSSNLLIRKGTTEVSLSNSPSSTPPFADAKRYLLISFPSPFLDIVLSSAETL